MTEAAGGEQPHVLCAQAGHPERPEEPVFLLHHVSLRPWSSPSPSIAERQHELPRMTPFFLLVFKFEFTQVVLFSLQKAISHT